MNRIAQIYLVDGSLSSKIRKFKGVCEKFASMEHTNSTAELAKFTFTQKRQMEKYTAVAG